MGGFKKEIIKKRTKQQTEIPFLSFLYQKDVTSLRKNLHFNSQNQYIHKM